MTKSELEHLIEVYEASNNALYHYCGESEAVSQEIRDNNDTILKLRQQIEDKRYNDE